MTIAQTSPRLNRSNVAIWLTTSGNKFAPTRVWIDARERRGRGIESGLAMETIEMGDFIKENFNKDGVDRRGFLKCMAWAGTGTLCVIQGGVLKSFALSDVLQQKVGNLKGDLSFVQISDSHIGFSKAANPDVTATLREAIAKVNALPTPPSFVLHTGDLTQLSKPEEFDTLSESLKSLKTERVFYVPGEHD